MAEELKKYQYQKRLIGFWFLAASIFYASSIWWMRNGLAGKILGILSFLYASMWLITAILAVKRITLATTEHEIIFTKGFFSSHIHIPVKDIVRIGIQKYKRKSKVFIWYYQGDKIQKERLVVQNLRKKDEEELYEYLKNIGKVSKSKSEKMKAK
jgi:hypothetical protein